MRLRALVFDDDAVARRMLWFLLDSRGYEVFTFPNPGQCPLSRAPDCVDPQGGDFADLIISDLEMPDVKGLDFIEGFLKKGYRCQAIALISGVWSDALDSRARQIAGCKLLKKPLKVEELTKWLDEVEPTIKPDRVLTEWRNLKV